MTTRVSRRQFLRGGLLAAAGAGLVGASRRAWARDSEFVPAVANGTGYGGAVAALRLRQAGIASPCFPFRTTDACVSPRTDKDWGGARSKT
jgi:hypothetical protein